MTVTLVDLPDGQQSDVGNRLRQIIAAINGYRGQGFRWNTTAYTHNTRYSTQMRNLGTGGLHWAVYRSTANLSTAVPIVEVQDAGLFVTDTDFRVYAGLNVVLNVDSGGVTVGAGYPVNLGGGLVVTGTITATGRIIAGGALEADGGLDVIGGAIISGSVTLNGAVGITGLTSIVANSASTALTVKNLGAGPLLDVQRTSGASALSVASSGLLTASNGVSTTTVSATAVTATTVAASSTVSGSQLVSTVLTGTPPLVVSSTTEVPNLNAERIGGYTTGGLDLRYVNEAGDTMSGSLTISTNLTVTGELTVGGNTTLGNAVTDALAISGDATVGRDLTVNGQLNIKGNTTLGDSVTDALAISGDATVGRDLTVNGQLNIKGNTTLGDSNTDTVTVTGPFFANENVSLGNGATDLTIITGETRFKGGTSAGSWRVIPPNVASPGLDWYDNTGANLITFNNAASPFQHQVYGNSYVSGEMQIDGNVRLGNGSTDATRVYGTLQVDANATFNGSVALNDPVLLTDFLDVVGTEIRLNSAFIDFDIGNAGAVSRGGVNWDGYITVKHDGAIMRLYYFNP